MEDSEEDFFKHYGDYHMGAITQFQDIDFTLEELYQAIKKRLMKELHVPSDEVKP